MTKHKKEAGLHRNRLTQNPEEKRFVDAWEKSNVLRYILDPNNRGVTPSDRDEQVAATIIQWLGTPVGRAFLQDLGYEKVR
jgi:hypothetical protein